MTNSPLPTFEPECSHIDSALVELVISGRPRDLGGFSVRRVLPAVQRRRLGPFVFFDHMGPALLPAGSGMDVRPHPHIALATVTYLFDGEIIHKDSLGSDRAIRPGDVNWMIAGRGIVHSERSSVESRRSEQRVHGIQSWVALPVEHEETAPRFEHHPAATIPSVRRPGVVLDVIAGHAYGVSSPIGVLSPTLYAHARMESGARLAIEAEHDERGFYVVEGAIGCDAQRYEAGAMVILRPGAEVTIEAAEATRLMLVGGAKLDGERFIWWNFVSSSQERIERAKSDWKDGRFPKVPGDEVEFIPLPDR
jgi:redox-sensitive bicupin YhaK (pirin superfamily)